MNDPMLAGLPSNGLEPAKATGKPHPAPGQVWRYWTISDRWAYVAVLWHAQWPSGRWMWEFVHPGTGKWAASMPGSSFQGMEYVGQIG